MDMAFGTIFFLCPMRLAESGARATLVSGIIIAWAIPYIISNQLIGRFINARNAVKMLLGSSFAIAVISICFILVPGPMIQYLWVILSGIAGAFFFAPFQTFMKEFETGSSGLVRSTGLYTFAWSFGLACGPFVSGPVWENYGWKYCHALNIIIGFLCLFGIYFLSKMRKTRRALHDETSASVQKESVNYSGMPDLAWLGWIGSGAGCVVIAIIRGVFPKTATEYGVAVSGSGLALALLSFSQAFTGLFLCFSKKWMYRPLPVGAFGVCGIVSSILFGFGSGTFSYCVAAVLFGIYSGGFFFYLVFHSLVHPSKSARYIAVNEMVVGIGGTAGPFLGGVLSDNVGLGMPYYFSAALISVAVVVQIIAHLQKDERKTLHSV